MAARFCPQCGQEVSTAARFCPNCAARLDGADPNVGAGPSAGAGPPRLPRPPIVSVAGVDDAAQKSRKLLVPGMIAALVVLAIAVAVLAAQSRRQASLLASAAPPPASAPAVTNAPAAPPIAAPALTNAPTAPPASSPALTNAPTAPPISAPAVTNAPTAPAPALPPDVAAYLAFLQQIEQKRVAMNNDVSGATAMLGLAQGLGGMGGGMPDLSNDPEGADEAKQQAAKQDEAKQNMQRISQGYTQYALKWQGLVREFRGTPPPPACAPLAGRYQTFLGDYTTVISKMQVALLNHDSSGLPDLSAVAGVQAQVNTDGGLADTELGNLCGRYGVPKPFVISPEGGSPSLLGH